MKIFDVIQNIDPWSLLIGALTVLFGLVTVISFLLMIYYQRINKKLYRERYSYSWGDIFQGVQRILNYTNSINFTPDVIVSFSGSAGIIANLYLLLTERRILFYQIMINDHIAKWKDKPNDYIEIQTTRHEVYIPKAISTLRKDAKILLIDAVCVTGTNAYAISSHLRKIGFSKIVYACLLRVKPVNGTKAEPDFYYFDNPTTEWYWPWGKGK